MDTAIRDKALSLLSYRAHSRRELSDKLKRKLSCSEQDLNAVLDWLEEMGFLDDRSYAASVVRHCASKGYGAGRISSELSRRGISRDLWDEALTEMPDTDAALDRLLRTKLRNPDDREEVRRVSAFLARRGYSWDEIRRALERLNEEC